MERNFEITLMRSGKVFAARPGERILDAALRQEVWLPSACRAGTCGSCSATVVEGRVDHCGAYPAARLGSEVRLCCAVALTDLILDVEEHPARPIRTARRLPARVVEITRPSDDVAVITLRLPASETLRYRPGQYVTIIPKDARPRPFSIANGPRSDGTIELHVGRIPGGQFTDYVYNELQSGEVLRLEGPLGSFGLQEGSARPAVFIAGGTGIAPIKAILEAAAQAAQISRRMHVYWGIRRPEGLYDRQWISQLASCDETIRFTPVVSEPISAELWTGRRGLVHHAVMEDLPDLSEFEAYVCGNPALIEAAFKDLTCSAGLAPVRFYSDAFYQRQPPAGAGADHLNVSL